MTPFVSPVPLASIQHLNAIPSGYDHMPYLPYARRSYTLSLSTKIPQVPAELARVDPRSEGT